jgi:uncharacterized protein (TIGR02147 family)
MSLLGYEKKYFLNLVIFNQTQNDDKRSKAFREMAVIVRENKIRKIGKDALAYYDSWLHAVIRELAPSLDKPEPAAIARKCRLRVSLQDVEQSLTFLLRTGLLRKTIKGKFVQTEKIVEGDTERIPQAIRSMNRQMAQLAEHAIDEVPVNHREFTGITMGISKESYKKILGTLENCRKKVLDIISKEEQVDRVYRLNLQLFPLTVIEENNDDEEL